MASAGESSSLNSDIGDSIIEEKQSSLLQASVLPLFPLRPCSIPRSGSVRKRTTAVENAPVKRSAHIRTYTPETPSIAPQYRKNGFADYFPWTGTHPEDFLTEVTSRQGFYDKVQVSQNELGTARPCIWPSLKHKSGLQILSSLFVSAIEHRQAHRTVTASSTFKPPPRVTLTDTKREAWLRDLADPLIPLRRLSRTIPHGIRGKALLEHCLVKDIPITRAVWLAKCVGANEIRAFKRKGASGAFTVGGEEKWIKDWTTNVQQFVETVMSECGNSDWRCRIFYCARLMTYLYSERLLNQDQYLEWITSSLRSCDLDSIPMWILIAQTNWKELLRYRQRGKHLTEAILTQLSKASAPTNGDAFSSLSDKLTQLLISILVTSPACFILPLCWSQYEGTIRSGLEKVGVKMIPKFKRLCQRNHQLQKSAVSDIYSSQNVEERQIIALLDEIPAQADLSSVARTCLEKFMNRSLFISTCLCWATSPSRNGFFKIYIAVRLFRLWAKLNVEVEEPLLDFLAPNIIMPPLQKVDVYKVLAELVHSRTISVSKYLRRLMAKGSLVRCKNRDGSFPTDVQWIFELPLDGLPSHVLNLRQILYASTGTSITKEKDDLAAAKAEISAKIEGFFTHAQVLEIPEAQQYRPTKLSQTIKSALGRWVRRTVASQLLSRQSDTTKNDAFRFRNIKGPCISMTPEQFGNIRGILETLDEYPILADVIKMCSKSVDIVVLTVASDTVNYHFDIFSAIGAADSLFEALYDRYEEFCGQAVKSKSMTESLIDLNYRLSHSRTERGHLQSKLLTFDHNSTLSACSPISDYITEQLHPSESAFMESVERSFTSGTLMEKHVLEQVFKKIMTGFQKSWCGSGDRAVGSLTDLLLRLRSYGASLFETLFYQWLDQFFVSTPRPKLQQVMPSFICAGIITLNAVLERTMIAYHAMRDEGLVASLAFEAFELLTTSDRDLEPISTHKTYRFHAQQKHIFGKMASLIASVLHATVSTCSKGSAMVLLESRRIIPVIQGLSQVQTGECDLIRFALEDNISLPPVQQAIDWLIYSSDEAERSDVSLRFRLSKLFIHTTIFNLPLCRLKLRAILMEQSQSHRDTACIVISILQEETSSRSDVVMNMWIGLLDGIPDSYAIQICEKAESELLTLFSETAAGRLTHRRRVMQSMVRVINATASGITESGTSVTLLHVTELINGILSKSPAVPGSPSERVTSHQDNLPGIDDSITNIDILLRLLSIHHSVGLLAKCSESVLVALLLALSNLLLFPSLSAHVEISDYVFDVLAILTDSVTDEICFQCIQILRDQNHAEDARLQYIFGYSHRVEGEWLQSVSNHTTRFGSRTEKSQQAAPARLPYALRRWEMVQEATPFIAENDTSLSLTLFGTREVVF